MLEKEIEDPNNPGEMIKIQETSKTPTQKYNMKNPTDRNKFYRTLLENSGYVEGSSQEVRDIQIAFGDILTESTREKIARENGNPNKQKTYEELLALYGN